MVNLLRGTGYLGWRNNSPSFLLLTMVSLFVLGTSSISFALCTAADSCSGCTSKGERLKCKFDTLADEGVAMIDTLQQAPFAEMLTPATRNGLNKSKDRLDKQKKRLQADDFHLLVKKKDSSCQMVEAVGGKNGNGDGVCDSGEECAEVLGDGIGDDDGICSPVKGKNREVCVQICDEEATLQDEDNADENFTAELEGVYDDMAGQASEMNTSLKEVASQVSAVKTAVTLNDPCPLDTGGLSRTNSLIYGLARIAAITARGGADIAERLCDQQVMMNCAMCCAPAEGIAGVFEAAWTAVELVESSINSATIDTALGCVGKLKSSADSNNSLLSQIEGDLIELETTHDIIIRLLNTPLGQRESATPISNVK